MLNRTRLRGGLLCLLCAGSLVGLRAQDGPAPENPAFLKWLKQQEDIRKGVLPAVRLVTSDQQRLTGWAPSPEDISGLTVLQGRIAAALPAKFDLRPANRVSPVRNQGAFGTCWTFGTMASLESTEITKGRPVPDYAEWHLAYYCYTPFPSADAPIFPSFVRNPAPNFGDDPIFDLGGNTTRSTAILARGTGAVAEANCPYQQKKPYAPGTLPKGTEPLALRVTDAQQVPFNATSKDDLKTVLMTNGAVAISIRWDDPYYNAAKQSFRDTTATSSTNHVVTVVGWDDDYPAANFLTPASSNGAWIVRNSWGSTWGDGGYFYMAYDCTNVYKVGTVFQNRDLPTVSTLYQYDPLGWTSAWGSGSGTPPTHMANVFTARADERITAVSFYTSYTDANYAIRIARNVTGAPSTGTDVTGAAWPQRGTFHLGGYHTVLLNEPISVKAGEKFAVQIQFENAADKTFPLVMEAPDSNGTYSKDATSNPGESFYSRDRATWTDMTTTSSNRANFCIKAFATADGGAQSPLTIKTQPVGAKVLVGKSVSLKADVGGGTPPYTFVWKKDGSVVSGATETFALAAFTAKDAGSYTFTVTDSGVPAQTLTSAAAVLAVRSTDFLVDGTVDVLDLGLLVRAMGTRKGDALYNPAADLNDDGAVDTADLTLFLATVGK